MKSFLAALAALASLSGGLAGQEMILNGDFENNSSSGCSFNLSNTAFTAVMDDATAFGSASEIDLMQTGTCGYGTSPQSGMAKVGIGSAYGSTVVDAFSFHLSSPIVAGNDYQLSFWAHAIIEVWSPDVGTVEIGISSNPDDFGQQIYAGTPSALNWKNLVTSFTAPVSGSYLTVRQQGNTISWNHIDNFSLVNLTPQFELDVSNLVNGQTATLTVENGTPNGNIGFAYSLVGAGPSGVLVSACGSISVDLSQPISVLGVEVADANGSASLSGNVPAGTAGIVVWFQALDLSNCRLTPVKAEVIQ
ncbi:MAG: hypothetical protein DWQ01_17215 [Planctomycetota bacterium]|nr:MAG: hypothetical protein DWQ01_17215 [Planctomycetota bacterium]